MTQRQAEDPRVRALAEFIHQIRPTWHRGGIIGALHVDKRQLPELIRAAVNAALDPSAETPAAINHRDGTAWTPETKATPIPTARICRKCSSFHVGDEECVRPNPEANIRGIQAARQALATVTAIRNTPASDAADD